MKLNTTLLMTLFAIGCGDKSEEDTATEEVIEASPEPTDEPSEEEQTEDTGEEEQTEETEGA